MDLQIRQIFRTTFGTLAHTMYCVKKLLLLPLESSNEIPISDLVFDISLSQN